jgi:type IV pilus assembly protein PilY1
MLTELSRSGRRTRRQQRCFVINRNSLIAALIAVSGLAAPFAVQAQTSINEDFTRATTSNAWWFFNGACLTAGQAAGVEPTVTTTGTGASQVTTVNTPGQIPGCSTIASSYYNKTSGERLVGGYNGVAGGGTTTLPDPLINAPAAGEGALRFTNGAPYGFSENGGIVFATPFPTGQGVSITFKTVTYRGNSGGAGGDGADGISFFLMDASQLNTSAITGTSSGNGNGLGSWGGSLGYTCSNVNSPYNGLIGGYVAVGIDEYGNFLNGANLMPGYTGSNTATGDNTQYGYGYKPGRIGMRGAGSIAWSVLNQNYPTYYPSSLSAAAQNSAVTATCKNGAVVNAANGTDAVVTTTTGHGSSQVTTPTYPLPDYAPIPSAYVELPSSTQIANEAAMSRPAATPIFYQLKITQNGLLSLSYSTCPPTSANGCSAFTSVIKGQNITTSNGALPANFLFGFAGSTGGSSNIHEILCFRADPATSASSSAGASEKQSAKLETGVQAYFAYYNPSNGWTGRVTASSLYIDQYGNVDVANTPNWDASCNLTGVAASSTCSTTGVPGPTAAQGPTNRTILTWSGTGGIPFEYNSLTTAEQTLLTAGDVTTSVCDNNLTSSVPYATSDRVSYLRGDRTCEVNQQGVGQYRRRTSVLADIMDSSPIWVGAPSSPYAAVWSDKLNPSDPLPENATTSTTSYSGFANTYQNRTQVVYVGSNDGLMHAFRSGAFNSTSGTCTTPNVSPPASCFSYNDGLEMMAYMPGAVVQTINAYQAVSATNPANALAPVDYSNPQYGHNYFVDATPGTGDLFYNGQWHTWLVSGLGPGGQAIFALDITNPGSTTLSATAAGNFSEANAGALVMGEWNNTTITCQGNTTCGQSLGNTYGTPQIRRLHDGRWGFIFGNGLGSATGDAGIFVAVLDPTSAAPTFYYLSTNTASTTKPNGIAFVTAADLDGDHITDYVYAGDLQGNVWRFDLTSSTETNWAVTPGPLFTATSGGQPQPITTAVVVASGSPSPGMQSQVMVLFGTGQRVPLTNANGATYATNVQSLYGVWDWNLTGWNSLGSSVQYAALTAAQAGVTTLTPANLLQQVVTIGVDGNRDINNTTSTPCWAGQTGCTGGSAQFGWYLNFPGTEEQVVYSPELVQQAITVNSIVPAANAPTSCNILSDTGFTYVLSAMTGLAFNEVFLPPDEAVNPGVNTNQAYLDPHAIGMQTNATGSSFITQNGSGTSYLVYETNQVEGGSGSGSGSGNNNIQGGTLGLNLPPNTVGRRLSWTELR